MFNMFKKTLKCKLCNAEEKKNKMWTLNMNTLDGVHSIKICRSCASNIEEIKGQVGVWMTEK